MFKVSTFILSFFLIGSNLVAQTTIQGSIKDKQGEPIPYANIYIADTFEGTNSDANGNFILTTDLSGSQTIVISFIGFQTVEKSVVLEGKAIELPVLLKEEINKVDGITITAGAFEASDVKKNTVLKPLDIVTTASAAGDIMGAINTLPGTATVGESGRLFVRGGEGYETKVFIDGLEVRNAFGATAPNVPTRGRFSPFLFKGTTFSTGGYSAEYGQALSSALVLNSNDLPNESQADISLMSVGGDVAYTKRWEKTSISGKVQYTDLRPYQELIKQDFDWEEAPHSYVTEFVFRHQLNKDGMLKLYVNADHSDMTIKEPNLNFENRKDTIGVKNKYFYVNASYRDIINSQWSMKGGVSVTRNRDFLDFNSDNIFSEELGLHGKMTWQWDPSDKWAINMGTDWFSREFLRRIQSVNEAPFQVSFKENLLANFVEADYFASNMFVIRTGIRYEYTSLTNQHFVSPRIAMSYKLDDAGQVSLAYGKFTQAPQNEYSIVQSNLRPERATHYILNYQYNKDNRIFRVETYLKKYDDLVKFTDLMDFNPNNYNNSGFGEAKGVDVFWRDNQTLKNTDYWVSYSYVDSERDYQNFDQLARPAFISNHNLSIVVKHRLGVPRMQVGATYNYASPRHYTNPNLEGFQNSKTPAFHDISLNAAFLIKQNIILYMSSSNVLGRDNIFGYRYASQTNDQGVFQDRAIGQGAKRFIFMGLFITLTKNKQANQLDNL